MKISELFRQLSYGELSNLAISNSGSGDIAVEKHPQLIQYANDGLTALHSRFLLIEKDLLIEQVAHITSYHLKSRYAVNAGETSGELYHYIRDRPEAPFEDDLVRVLAVFHVSGAPYALNDTEVMGSLFTPSPLILQVPEPVAGQPLAVTYQAKHPKLLDQGVGLLDQEIDIPHYLENALQQFIAARVFQHMGGQENLLTSQGYDMAFERDCQGIEIQDLANQSTSTSHTKLEQRGFV